MAVWLHFWPGLRLFLRHRLAAEPIHDSQPVQEKARRPTLNLPARRP
jgi:hypothetical protein